MIKVYFERVVPLTADPLWTAARLTQSGSPYVLYEDSSAISVALGAIAEVIVDPDTVQLRYRESETSTFWYDDPLPVVASMLDEIPMTGWRAYGWAAFELAQPQVGTGTLLHLVVPSQEVRLCAGVAVLRATTPAELDSLAALVSADVPEPSFAAVPVDVRQPDTYSDSVAAAVSEIQRGLLQKVILCRTVTVPDIDLVGTYVTGRRANTPARSYLLNLGGIEVAGFSPETVVGVNPDGRVHTQPLAGTRALTGDPEVDHTLRADLLTDPKEIFEHAISVRLAVDELTSLCTPGSVVVEEFMDVLERGTVQHLASRVAGTLPADRGPWDAFRALFPAITASGIPKAAAFESIRRHEPHRRGLYSGAVMTIDHTGSLDTALVLRSVFRRDGETWLCAGAGIVSQSDPAREFEETCEKLASVARFLVPTATAHPVPPQSSQSP
ncbi:salicylate synthase [Kibdelosporangium aridum]|uniref:Anthranilate synthase component 1 n=1 Tax=Kibdelosporangium aridum TaxID=2030 RepID=A0A1W2BM85_KIBAR|nr:salicylate synthase [Kibdelosporangium aridum]SMC73903.1 anthranilate synthase component 1 [Kibdelosporangium aridum]